MIRIRSSGAVVSLREFRQMHEPTIIPPVVSQADAEMFGADVIVPTPSPDPGLFATVESGEPEQIKGTWTQTWTVTPISVEQARQILRARVAGERAARRTPDLEKFLVFATSASMLKARGVTGSVIDVPREDGTVRKMTPDDAIDAWLAVHQRIQQLDAAQGDHLAAIDQLTDTAACAAYDIEAGWPA